MNENRDSIMRMARGAFEERVDYEMDKVIQNILDPNTKATAKRKITPTIEKAAKDAESATATKMAECIAGGIKDTVDAIHRDPDGFFKGGAR